MSAHGFKSLFMAASVAGAALGCYLVSLNVASERAKLEAVENEIVLAQRDIRLLQTEIGTRGRLAQLERWNAGFIRLSAPTADQFLEGGFQLATMVKPAPKPVIEAPVVLASAPAEQGVAPRPMTSDGENARPAAQPRPRAPSAEDMMHIASFERPPVQSRPTALSPPATKSAPPRTVVKNVAGAKPANPGPSVTRPAAAKGSKIAAADTLAPLPSGLSAAKAPASGGAWSSGPAPRKTKESGTPR